MKAVDQINRVYITLPRLRAVCPAALNLKVENLHNSIATLKSTICMSLVAKLVGYFKVHDSVVFSLVRKHTEKDYTILCFSNKFSTELYVITK
jgi:hypothetical protein